MTTETVATSSLWVSATLPATNDAAGFVALSWTKIGELTDLGSVLGRAYNTSKHAPIDTAQQIEKKASYTLPKADMMVGWDDLDAGQVIINTGANSNSFYSFKVVKQSGGIRYFTAQVMEFVENFGTVDNIVQGKFSLLRQTDTIKA
jgi:hypothetical protein